MEQDEKEGSPDTGVKPKMTRPEGKTDRQLLLEARDALVNGAPKEAVKKQLEEWGVKF